MRNLIPLLSTLFKLRHHIPSLPYPVPTTIPRAWWTFNRSQEAARRVRQRERLAQRRCGCDSCTGLRPKGHRRREEESQP